MKKPSLQVFKVLLSAVGLVGSQNHCFEYVGIGLAFQYYEESQELYLLLVQSIVFLCIFVYFGLAIKTCFKYIT